MSRLILLIALATVGWLLYKLYFQKILAQGRIGKIKLAAVALGLLFLFLVVIGRAPPIFALIGAAMTQLMRIAPLLLRYAPSLKRFLHPTAVTGAANAGSGNPGVSTVRTRTIDMQLDQATGKIDGTVRLGQFKSRALGSLSLEELRVLHEYCANKDPEAARLLEAYLAREHADSGWQPGNRDDGTHQSSSKNPENEASMSKAEALNILGLQAGASKQEIIDAHRSLMRRFHPDKGGSHYFASKINMARQCLVG
ncbi:MAG: molecular chaperone DnaJ [Granulosicoccus sp.]